MQRPAGVVVSAVLLVLLSLVQLFMAGLMVLAASVQPHASAHVHTGAPVAPPPPWMPIFMYVLAAFFLALAVWGIATVVGMVRLRRWARYSILVIGGGMALLGLFSLLSLLAISFMPLPTPQRADPSQAHLARMTLSIILGVIGVFYAGMLVLGSFWLVYFNRRTVQMAFDQAQGRYGESRRPFLVALLAALEILGAPLCLVMAFLPFPALVLGFALKGWEKAALYAVFTVLQIAGGIGLWRLEEWGRRLSGAFLAFGILNCMVVAAILGHPVQRGDQRSNASQPAARDGGPSSDDHVRRIGMRFDSDPCCNDRYPSSLSRKVRQKLRTAWQYRGAALGLLAAGGPNSLHHRPEPAKHLNACPTICVKRTPSFSGTADGMLPSAEGETAEERAGLERARVIKPLRHALEAGLMGIEAIRLFSLNGSRPVPPVGRTGELEQNATKSKHQANVLGMFQVRIGDLCSRRGLSVGEI